MLKAYKYRLLPTDSQIEHLDKLFKACRFVYNIALETKKRAWESGRVNLSAYDLMKQLTQLKRHECSWLKEFSATTLESEISHMDSAYTRFFKKGGVPRFKNCNGRQSAEFRQWVKINGDEVYLQKLGFVQFVKHRDIGNGQVKNCTVSKTITNKYFVSILINDEVPFPEKRQKRNETTVGVDLGLKSFAVFSDGSKIDNPKYLDEELKRLRIEQRKLARRFKKGADEQSKGYYRQRLVIAKLHEKIKNKRTDFLQKLTTDLIRNNDTICVETLHINGMVKNKNLSKAINDASWGEFVRMLKYKGEWYGKNVVEIGMFEASSKTCSNCGFHYNKLALSHREWDCTNCGVTHDRDINAAINIKKIGLKAQASTVKTSQKTISIGCETMPH